MFLTYPAIRKLQQYKIPKGGEGGLQWPPDYGHLVHTVSISAELSLVASVLANKAFFTWGHSVGRWVGVSARSRAWQHVQMSDVSLGTRP